MEFKLVINDPKTGKSYPKTVNDDYFIGKKIGDSVIGSSFGLTGYELKVTGGSDKSGFAMRPSIPGSSRKKLLMKKGDVGANIKEKGVVYRKSIVGNTIGQNTAQINLTVLKHGTKSIEELLGIQPKKEKKEEAKAEQPKKEEKTESKK